MSQLLVLISTLVIVTNGSMPRRVQPSFGFILLNRPPSVQVYPRLFISFSLIIFFIEPTVISSSGKHDYVGRYAYTGTRDYTGLCTIPTAFEFRSFLGGDELISSYCHDLAIRAGNELSHAWNTTLLVGVDLTGFMVNIILPSTDVEAIAFMRDTLDIEYNIYIVYDVIPADKSDTGEEIYFTRLSAQVYLELQDFMRLATLVPELLARGSSKK
jgi:hercynylcysteine S-oxide lyase